MGQPESQRRGLDTDTQSTREPTPPGPFPMAEGTLFGGGMACYVLRDGRRVVSQRGIVRVLTSKTPEFWRGAKDKQGPREKPEKNASGLLKEGAKTSRKRRGADSGKLARYLERLPSRYAHLTEQPGIVIAVAAGAGSSRALVRDVEWVSDILDAYVEASLAGDLHPSQEHLARNAHALQKAARKTGWRALVDEATGHQASRAKEEMERYFQRLFRFEASEWQRTFSRSFALALDKLHHGTWDGHGAYPRHLSNAFGFTYSCLLGEAAVAELRRRNPNPRFGRNHHQLIEEGSRRLLASDLTVAEALARQSFSGEEWRARMRAHFLGEAFQLHCLN